MSELCWQRPRMDQNDPGAGGAAGHAFGSKSHVRVESFVREDLQNRVDAIRDDHDGPVRCVIRWLGLPKRLISKYFPEQFQDELVESTLSQVANPVDREVREKKIRGLFASTSFHVLVIEDFGTTGLNGPVNSKIPVKEEGKPLYHPTNALTCFLRRNGRSGKTGKSLGGAGLGRHVYYMASEISAKLVYTVPTDVRVVRDRKLVDIVAEPMFFGQSLQNELERHVEGKEETYCGYLHLTAPESLDGFAVPYGVQGKGRDVADQARKDFRLVRKSGDPGCSIIIPFPKASISPESLRDTIVAEFALSILAGELEVELQEEMIDSESILELSSNDNVNTTNRFLMEARVARPDCQLRITPDQLGRELRAADIDGEVLTHLAERFQSEDLVCVEVEVCFNDSDEGRGVLTVAACKVPVGRKGRGIVARQGLAIRKYCGISYSDPQNSCVLIKDADRLSTLLKRSEPASHEMFVAGEIQPEECEDPKGLIERVTTLHKDLVSILAGLDSEEDDSIFSDLLSSGGGQEDDDDDDHESKADPFSMAMIDGDQVFKITPSAAYEAPPGAAWEVLVVLDSIQGAGRARRSFQAGSFDLRNAGIRASGGQAAATAACQLRVTIEDAQGFELEVGPCGFPEWADVRIQAVQITAQEGQE